MIRVALFLLLIVPAFLFAQSADELLKEGLALEKDFKLAEALQKYEAALKINPDHPQVLVRASRMTSNAASRITDKDKKREKLSVAEKYAKRSLQLDDRDPEAHFALLVVWGLQSEIAPSPREKLKDAKLVREEAEKIIKLDPNYALAYFVLGKWHYELSKLTWVERVACDLFYGGLPEGVSMQESVKNYNKALQLDPTQIIILYGHASALHYEGKDEEAIRVLEKALSLPLRDADDEQRKGKCRELLKEIKD
jgi:tetratricopeptide (TPR) repeat protein